MTGSLFSCLKAAPYLAGAADAGCAKCPKLQGEIWKSEKIMGFVYTWRTVIKSSLFGLLLAIAAVVAQFSSAFAQSDYFIASGDMIEINVIGMPDLKQRASVSLSGEINPPLLDGINVVGMRLPDLLAKVRERLPTTFRRWTPDQRDAVSVVIEPKDVYIDIVEYRPIYVIGDVSKPGEQPYRASMTVRQAVAVAGGYDLIRFRMENPFMASADLHSEYERLWMDFARTRALILRLEAEMAGRSEVGDVRVVDSPIAPQLAAQIAKSAADQLTIRAADYLKEVSYHHLTPKGLDQQLSTLTEQQQKEQEGNQLDMDEMNRIRDLYTRGAVPITRVTEIRRVSLLSATRAMETAARLGDLQLKKAELTRKLEKFNDQRRLDNLRELEDANLKLAETRLRLQSVGEKLLYTGAMKSQLARGTRQNTKITIIRTRNREQFEGNEETQLVPGDTVEISLSSDRISESTASSNVRGSVQ